MARHLSFFLEPILLREDNYLFLIELLQFIKVTEDVQSPKSNVCTARHAIVIVTHA